MKSIGIYTVTEGYYTKDPSKTGGQPRHKSKEHCLNTLKTFKPLIGKKVELFFKVVK